MKRLFFGGIHPKYNKEMSSGNEDLIKVIPDTVVIPLRQHIGKPCEPLVKVGDRVVIGQKIGDSEGMCVPVHASVSGTVVEIGPKPHTSGTLVDAIVIKNDFKDESIPLIENNTPLEELDEEYVLHAVREAGIVGMGGAAFPGNIKALSALGKINTLIANACECEPYITADDLLIRTYPDDVLEGMRILRQLLKPERTVVAIEDNKKIAIDKLRELLKDSNDIEVVVLPTRYPQGSEKQLIQALTGREVPPGGLPVSVGCAVFNVSTFAAIYRAVREGKPLTQRLVTVSGEAIGDPQNFVVRIGTPFSKMIESAGGLNDKTERVISGGPMMGFAQADLEAPVVKATNSILCLLKDENGAAENPVCLRCGKCVAACPMRLMPLYMYRYGNAGDVAELERINVLDCIECGCCAFTCPGKLPLVEVFRKGKKMVREAKSK